MNKWRKNKGKFEKVNGPLLDRLFDWWDGTTSGEFTTARLRMTARARRWSAQNRAAKKEDAE